jgi:hypothetical protein
MPYHSNSVDKIKEKVDNEKKEKEKKPRKKTQKELFDKQSRLNNKKKDLTKVQMEQIKKHSKLHKGGMNSFHIKNMIKFMKQGSSFMKAHMKSQQLDKAKN